MKSKPLCFNDVTLRDGMHAISHQYTTEQMVNIARALDASRVDIIEVCHGDGLNGHSINYGFAKHSDWEYIAQVQEVCTYSKIAALLLPGIGTQEDLKEAKRHGVNTMRIATHCSEANIAQQHIELSRSLGFDTVGFLMMAHRLSTPELIEQAKKMENYGAHCVYVTDSAGALLMNETREKIQAMKEALDCEVGFHNHNNLSLGVANSIIAIEAGCDRIDASLAGMGAGAGNCPLEILVAVLLKMEFEITLDLYGLMDAADTLVRPLQKPPVQTDGGALSLGYAGVYSSFLRHAQAASNTYGVDVRDILIELGNRKMVGGQEDMIIDVALDLKKGS